MKLSDVNTEATIKIKDGFDVLQLQQNKQLSLQLTADKGTNGELFITYDGADLDLHVQIKLPSDCQIRLLFWNQLSERLQLHVDCSGEANSCLHLGIADLSKQESNYHVHADLLHEGMEIAVTTICQAAKKHWLIDMNHLCPHTVSNMANFAVVEQHGDYRMEACGRIVKGAYESTTHQKSRVLTMSDEQQSEVLPMLYIDEDEVKASHATTLGQPDEAQLYYLRSRGLNRHAALGLLKLGYLLPICEVLKDPDMSKQLRAWIEEKVMTHD